MSRPRRQRRTLAASPDRVAEGIQLFLCDDVMLGRGIDQILPDPCDPTLHESYVIDARVYIEIAEQRAGPIPAGRGGRAPRGIDDERRRRSRAGGAPAVLGHREVRPSK